MTDHNIATVRSFYDSLAAGDLEKVFANFAAEIDWREADGFPYGDRNPYRSPEEVAEGVLARIGRDWEGFAISTERYIGEGDRVILFGRYSGTNRATGKSIDLPMIHAWTLRDGKIVAFQQYTDTALVQEAMR